MFWYYSTFTFTIHKFLYDAYYPLLFPNIFFWVFEKILWRVMNRINRICGESFDIIMNMIVDKHFKPCKLLVNINFVRY